MRKKRIKLTVGRDKNGNEFIEIKKFLNKNRTYRISLTREQLDKLNHIVFGLWTNSEGKVEEEHEI